MTLRDLLLLLSVPFLAICLADLARRLRIRGDVARRLVAAHATPSARALLLVQQLLRYLAGGANGPPGAREQAFVSAVSLFVLAVPTVIGTAVTLDRPPASGHMVAAGLGIAAWGVIVELPGAPRWHLRKEPRAATHAALTAMLILLALDVVITLLAFTGAIEAGGAIALCRGAAVVALADVASQFLGLVAAAYER